jgi:hypothetical protein
MSGNHLTRDTKQNSRGERGTLLRLLCKTGNQRLGGAGLFRPSPVLERTSSSLNFSCELGSLLNRVPTIAPMNPSY